MFCIKCGKELQDSDAFCSKCGQKVSSEEPSKITVEQTVPVNKYLLFLEENVKMIIGIALFIICVIGMITFFYVSYKKLYSEEVPAMEIKYDDTSYSNFDENSEEPQNVSMDLAIDNTVWEYVDGAIPGRAFMDDFKLYNDGTGVCDNASVWVRTWRVWTDNGVNKVSILTSNYISLDYSYSIVDGQLELICKDGNMYHYKPISTPKAYKKYEDKYGY